MHKASLLAALAIATAVPAAAQQNARGADVYETRIDTTFAFDRRGTVVLSAGSGDIVVRAWNRDQIQVRARSERSVVRMDATPSRVSLEITRARGGDTRFEVTVPVGARISARATSGDITITGTKGSVDANTNSGDMMVEDVGDRVDLRSMSGDIMARTVTGTCEINTLNGEITLIDINGEVDATSVSGDLDLRNVVARFVRARTTSGDVAYDGNVDPTGRYELGSHSGSVYLTIPQTASAQLTLATYSGAIESDFLITLKPGEHGIGASKRFTFDIGKGESRVSAESFSGDITIRSKARRP